MVTGVVGAVAAKTAEAAAVAVAREAAGSAAVALRSRVVVVTEAAVRAAVAAVDSEEEVQTVAALVTVDRGASAWVTLQVAQVESAVAAATHMPPGDMHPLDTLQV